MEVLTGKSLEQRMDEQMQPGKMKIEGKDEMGRWVELPRESARE